MPEGLHFDIYTSRRLKADNIARDGKRTTSCEMVNAGRDRMIRNKRSTDQQGWIKTRTLVCPRVKISTTKADKVLNRQKHMDVESKEKLLH